MGIDDYIQQNGGVAAIVPLAPTYGTNNAAYGTNNAGYKGERSVWDVTGGAALYGGADTLGNLLKKVGGFLWEDNFISAGAKHLEEFKASHPEYSPEEVDDVWGLIKSPGAISSRVFGSLPFAIMTGGLIGKAGVLAAGAISYAIESQRAYDTAKLSGSTEDEANAAAKVQGIVNSVFNVLSGHMMNKLGGLKINPQSSVDAALAVYKQTGGKIADQTLRQVATLSAIGAIQGGANEGLESKIYGKQIEPGFWDRRLQDIVGANAAQVVFGLSQKYMKSLPLPKGSGDGLPTDLTQQKQLASVAVETHLADTRPVGPNGEIEAHDMTSHEFAQHRNTPEGKALIAHVDEQLTNTPEVAKALGNDQHTYVRAIAMQDGRITPERLQAAEKFAKFYVGLADLMVDTYARRESITFQDAYARIFAERQNYNPVQGTNAQDQHPETPPIVTSTTDVNGKVTVKVTEATRVAGADATPAIGAEPVDTLASGPTDFTARTKVANRNIVAEDQSSSTPGTSQSHMGWKLHLSTDQPEQVSAKLVEMKLTHKVGRSGQVGKDVTVYIGSKADADRAASAIGNSLDGLLKAPSGDALNDDVQFTKKVWGRFDISRQDNEFHQYGKGGIPWLNADMDPYNRPSDAVATAHAHSRLVKKYGEYYTGETGVDKSRQLGLGNVVIEGTSESQSGPPLPTETPPPHLILAPASGKILENLETQAPEGSVLGVRVGEKIYAAQAKTHEELVRGLVNAGTLKTGEYTDLGVVERIGGKPTFLDQRTGKSTSGPVEFYTPEKSSETYYQKDVWRRDQQSEGLREMPVEDLLGTLPNDGSQKYRVVMSKSGWYHIADSTSHDAMINNLLRDGYIKSKEEIVEKGWVTNDQGRLLYYNSSGENIHKINLKQTSAYAGDSVDETLRQGQRGATHILSDGRAIIQALNAPDSSTMVHELAHVMRRWLNTEDQTKLLDAYGATTWDKATEELHSRSFEVYMREGKAPTPWLSKVFDYFKTSLTRVYKKLSGEYDIQISDPVREVFDSMIGPPAKGRIELMQRILYTSPQTPSIVDVKQMGELPKAIDTPQNQSWISQRFGDIWRSVAGDIVSLKQGLHDTQAKAIVLPHISDAIAYSRSAMGLFGGELYDVTIKSMHDGQYKEMTEGKQVQLKDGPTVEFSTFRTGNDPTGVHESVAAPELAERYPLMRVGRKIMQYLGREAERAGIMREKNGVMVPYEQPKDPVMPRDWHPDFWKLVESGTGANYDAVVSAIQKLNPEQFKDFAHMHRYLQDNFGAGARRTANALEYARKIQVMPDAVYPDGPKGRKINLLNQDIYHALTRGITYQATGIASAWIFGQGKLSDVSARDLRVLGEVVGVDTRLTDEQIQRNLLDKGVALEHLANELPLLKATELDKASKRYADPSRPLSISQDEVTKANTMTGEKLQERLDYYQNLVHNATNASAAERGVLNEVVGFYNELYRRRHATPLVGGKVLKEIAKQYSVPTEMVQQEALARLSALDPSQMNEKQQKLVAQWARKVEGIDLSQDHLGIWNDSLDAITRKTRENGLENLAELHRQEDGDRGAFVDMLRVWQGVPLYKVGGSLWKAAQAASNIIGTAQTSLAVIPNLTQTGVLLPGAVGPVKLERAFKAALQNYEGTTAQVYSLIGLPRGAMLFANPDAEYMGSISKAIRTGFAKFTGLAKIEEFNNVVAGEVHRQMAEEWRGGSFEKKDVAYAKHLGLDTSEILGLLNNQMSDLTYMKVVQNGVAKTQFTSEHMVNRSKLENHPIGRIIFSYSNYAFGMGRALGTIWNDGMEAVRTKNVSGIQSFAKRVIMTGVTTMGAGIVSQVLRDAVKGNVSKDIYESMSDQALGALFETSLLGQAQRLIDPFKYDGGMIEKAWISMAPQLKAMSDFVGATLGYGKYSRFSMDKRLWEATKQNTPVAKGFDAWVNAIAYPELTTYQRTRSAVSHYEKSVLGQESQSIGDMKINPEYHTVFQEVARDDLTSATELAKSYYQARMAKGEGIDVAAKELRSSLLGRSPLALNMTEKIKFLSTQTPARRKEFITAEMKYLSIVNSIAPALGGD